MTQPIYKLKVSLQGAKPPIWRRIEVRGDTPLDRLHWIIQVAMGWEGGHLYEFAIRGLKYTDAETASLDGDETASAATLGALIRRPGTHFTYTYDFGDNWEHKVFVEDLSEPEAEVQYPRCIAGRRACPPEDIGGVWGYEELLAALKDPTNPEYGELLEWVGVDFDPAAFDLEGIQQELQGMQQR
jgi:hypothetical protein